MTMFCLKEKAKSVNFYVGADEEYKEESHQENSSKKELQLFNRINIPIENLLSWARGGAALTQSLLCYRITFGQNS